MKLAEIATRFRVDKQGQFKLANYQADENLGLDKAKGKEMRDEQRKRFLDRLDEPGKNWKFSMGDVRERALWPKYMEAYQDAINATASTDAPWFVVPADHKWFARLVVAAALLEVLERLNPEFPNVGKDAQKELTAARTALENDT
jgi:hypothetical protein